MSGLEHRLGCEVLVRCLINNRGMREVKDSPVTKVWDNELCGWLDQVAALDMLLVVKGILGQDESRTLWHAANAWAQRSPRMVGDIEEMVHVLVGTSAPGGIVAEKRGQVGPVGGLHRKVDHDLVGLVRKGLGMATEDDQLLVVQPGIPPGALVPTST